MITKNGILKRRRIGQSRRSHSIYDNLGHPYDINNNFVNYIGDNGSTYCLTKDKTYRIISVSLGKFCFDKDLSEKCKAKDDRHYEASQGEDYFITIINDKGHKRKYSHIMFELL